MKINRTFSIDYHLAKELQNKKNQSAIVESAVRRYLRADDDFDLRDVKSRSLMSVLYYREDTEPILKAVIKVILGIDD